MKFIKVVCINPQGQTFENNVRVDTIQQVQDCETLLQKPAPRCRSMLVCGPMGVCCLNSADDVLALIAVANMNFPDADNKTHA